MRAHEPPAKIGRFLIEDTLGFGATGAVYKAFDPVLNRRVAIKTLRVDLLREHPWAKTFIDRFYHEAELVGTLSHPNIVTLFDAGETEDQTPFLAMEYADGETVAARLAKQSVFLPREVLPLLNQIASALDYAHAKGVLHRDVKPSNLILHHETRVKITDFGIAKLVSFEADAGTLPPGKRPGRLTREGALVGSPSYMSPEQAQGEPVDGRTDVFSLGVVAFEMLTGRLPFEGSNITATLYNLLHRDPIRPTLLQELGIDGELWDEFFSRALAKNPENRFGTAREFVDAIGPLLDPGVSSTARHLRAAPTFIAMPTELGTIPYRRSSVPRVGPRPRKKRRSRAPLLALASGTAVFLGLAAVTHWVRRQETPPARRQEAARFANVTTSIVPEPPRKAVAPERPKESAQRDPSRMGLRRNDWSRPPAELPGIKPPRRTHWVSVRYPEAMRRQGVTGRVEVSFVVTASGKVEDVVLEVSTGSELDQAVVDAVRQWRYRPARRNGQLLAVRERYSHLFAST